MAKILFVDDDIQMIEMVKEWFARENHLVEFAYNGFDGLALMRSFGFDLIVLDWELPGMEGPDICKKFRDLGGAAPVLMLTGKGAIEEKERGYNCGADDYLTKPFHPKELTFRIKSLLNRTPAPQRNLLIIGKLTLDFNKAKAIAGEEEIKLTAREFSLLEFLMRHPGQIFDADAILRGVWESDTEVSPSSVRMFVSRLRDKLSKHEDLPKIETVPNFGYRLVKPGD